MTYPLFNLKTRDPGDFAIALLDAWATVADVLTFYQERIANEGYLRTATERRSILELARLVGYALRPGVAASAYLAYTIDEDRSVIPPKPTKTTIPKGSRVQSIPGPGELPQSFETSDNLEARSEWNNLQVRLSQPQNITLDNAQCAAKVCFVSAALNLKPNDRLLFVFSDHVGEVVMRSVQEAKAQFEQNRTEVTLQPVPFLVIAAVALLRTGAGALENQMNIAGAEGKAHLVQQLETARTSIEGMIENVVLGNYPPIDAAYFNHDRIYGYQAGNAAVMGLMSAVRSGVVRRAMSRPPRHRATRDAAPATDETFWRDPHIVAVGTAVLERLLALLQDTSFRHDLACFASSVIKEARPVNAQDREAVRELLEQVNEHEWIQQFWKALQWLQQEQTDESLEQFRHKALTLLDEFTRLLGVPELKDPLIGLVSDLLDVAGTTEFGAIKKLLQMAKDWIASLPKGESAGCEALFVTTSVEQLIAPLTALRSLQPATSKSLVRTPSSTFASHADTVPQLLSSFEPRLRDTLYGAWANAIVDPTPLPLKSVHVLRLVAQPFGYNAALKMGLKQNTDSTTKDQFKFLAEPDGDWKPSEAGDEKQDRLYLDAAYDAIVAPSYVVIRHGKTSSLAARLEEAVIRPRTAYGISSKTTQLTLSRAWWKPETDSMDTLRSAIVYAQSEELLLAEMPFSDDVQGDSIKLGELYDGLITGRWLIVCGERTDIPGVSGVKTSEVVMLSAVDQSFDTDLPGDKTRTTITIANNLTYRYKRDTVTIYGNVVKATHGETRSEILGNGDGSQSLQSFALKQPPLTFVSAATRSGIDSTLEVFVNDVQWHEADTLAGLGPKDWKFITKTDDEGKTTVIFGNGEEGARLPTGVANVKAKYRNGIGKAGNVKAEQISLLQTRPLGVKSVINPLAASGGADKDNRDQARDNAPLAVMSLDRLVSVQDYADFSRTFAGIGKTSATRLSDGRRELVYVTIAGADDIPIALTSELYRNLVKALRDFGDPYQPIQVEVRKLKLLVIQARVRVLPDYLWEKVEPDVRAALLKEFSFSGREFGQDALLSEAVSAIQTVKGVWYVDVDKFDAVDEQQVVNALAGNMTLANQIGLQPRVQVELAQVDLKETDPSKRIKPAEVAYFSPDIPDTVILSELTK